MPFNPENLYPSSPAPELPLAKSLTAEAEPAEREPFNEAKAAEIMFGADNGCVWGEVPPSGHYPEVASVADSFAQAYRMNGDTLSAEEAGAASKAAMSAFSELQVPQPVAAELSRIYQDYDRHPISPERMEAKNAETFDELRRSWGRNWEAKIDVARKAVQELERRVPGTMAELERTGMGSDPRVIKHFAEVGRRRGLK